MSWRIARLAVLTAGIALRSQAQGDLAIVIASQVRADVSFLSSEPTLTGWQGSRPGGKVEFAHYFTGKEPYEVDFERLDRWCAVSVSESPSQMTRAALFYVPSVTRGSLPPLPGKEDHTATRACRMQAIWYETRAEVSINAIVRELSSSWGEPNGQTTQPDIAGSGLWNSVVAWHRKGINVWAGPTGQRLIVYARRDIPRDLDLGIRLLGVTIKNQVNDAAGQTASMDSALTTVVLNRSHCDAAPLAASHEAESIAVNRLAKWLKASADVPPERRALALLVADSYVACTQVPSHRLAQLGAEFAAGCPQDGSAYSHNFRDQAERLDPKGLAGELAGLASLGEPCTLKGSWPDLVIEKGERLLKQFPPDRWTPWVHFAIARAHDAKLSFAYPGGDPEGGEVAQLNPAAKEQERKAAVEHFERFIQDEPDSEESVFAWQETWRLLAGLPPSPLHFGCGCE